MIDRPSSPVNPYSLIVDKGVHIQIIDQILKQNEGIHTTFTRTTLINRNSYNTVFF